jgi:polysaccharide biosynthesis protein PslH
MGPDLPLRILFIAPYAPTRLRTRTLHLIRSLASEGHAVTLAALWSNSEELAAIHQLSDSLNGLVSEKLTMFRSAWNSARSLPSAHPMQAAYSWSPPLAAKLAQTVKTQPFDVIHVEHLRGARYGLLLRSFLARAQCPVPIIWDSVDCISGLFSLTAGMSHAIRFRLAARLELPKTKLLERRLVRCFSKTLTVSEKDRLQLLQIAQSGRNGKERISEKTLAARIVVVPNGVDFDYFSSGDEKRLLQTLVISGKMSYHANATAAVRFIKEVMPLIWKQLPEAHLWIVGKDPPPELQKLGAPWDAEGRASPSANRETRIRITGDIEDIRPFLHKATIAVAPIQYGAGIQNKVLEALACGAPVVATPQAVDALQVQPGKQLLVAEGGRNLADSIIALIKDSGLQSQLARAGRLFVEQNHDWRSMTQVLTRVYRDAISGNPMAQQ